MTRHTVLGERLRELRQKLGLSQVDFGKRTGLLRSYISHVEKGRVVPGLDILEKMTTALNVPLYTVFLTDEKFLLKLTHEMPPATSPSAIQLHSMPSLTPSAKDGCNRNERPKMAKTRKVGFDAKNEQSVTETSSRRTQTEEAPRKKNDLRGAFPEIGRLLL